MYRILVLAFPAEENLVPFGGLKAHQKRGCCGQGVTVTAKNDRWRDWP